VSLVYRRDKTEIRQFRQAKLVFRALTTKQFRFDVKA
jgi:hypothetical protein